MKITRSPLAFMPALVSGIFLMPAGCCAGQQFDFKKIQQTYQGSVILPQVIFGGQPREATFSGREIDPAETVFSNIPGNLALSYNSYAFQATSTSALGNLVQLSGTSRMADHVEVVMVTWAKAANYPELAALDPGGYRHPVTATLYQLLTAPDGTTSLTQLDQNTAWVQIPWRPATLPNGSSYPYNGFAFKALIPLSAAVTAPEKCLIAISFNTQSAGISPLGTAGPYNELNLALSTASPGVGLDLDPKAVFRITNGVLSYPATGLGSSPMLRLATRTTPLPQPALQSPFEPVHSGTYQVRARISPENVEADTVLTIAKAAVTLETAGLTKSIADSDPFVTVTNQSPGLAVAITYGGSSTRPGKPGNYPFAIAVTDKDHTGSLSGNFHLTGLTYEQWDRLNDQPAGERGADPDSDGQANWLEYAVGGNPWQAQASQPLRLDAVPDGLKVGFMRRREMTQVRVSLECSTDLLIWLPVESVIETTDDFWESVSTTSVLPSAYFRLKADLE